VVAVPDTLRTRPPCPAPQPPTLAALAAAVVQHKLGAHKVGPQLARVAVAGAGHVALVDLQME
jgi:hypothetical protein